jgi:hypothetical protein
MLFCDANPGCIPIKTSTTRPPHVSDALGAGGLGNAPLCAGSSSMCLPHVIKVQEKNAVLYFSLWRSRRRLLIRFERSGVADAEQSAARAGRNKPVAAARSAGKSAISQARQCQSSNKVDESLLWRRLCSRVHDWRRRRLYASNCRRSFLHLVVGITSERVDGPVFRHARDPKLAGTALNGAAAVVEDADHSGSRSTRHDHE